jgi:FAD/FMN-containing dehydrogenase
VLSTARLKRCDAVDIAASQVTVGAGVTLTAVREHARRAGLDLAVDFAARDSATIGGAFATNAGGSRVIRFGTTRAQVIGVEAVLANGEIVGSLSGLPKETTGLHLPSVLSGSEGTLAIITAVRLKLVPWYQHTATAMVALESLSSAIDLLPKLRRELAMLDSVELLMPSAMSLVCEHLGRTCPVRGDAGAYLLVECAAHSNPLDDLLRVLTDHAADNATAIATDAATRASLIAFRDNVTAAINHVGVPLKLDIALPLSALATTTTAIEAIVAQLAPQSRLINFGHLAEGNLHLNILDAGDAASAITDSVLQLVIDRGGAISAEHGIGVAKTHWLVAQRGGAEVLALRAVKHALDPNGLLNPGVLLPSQ